MRGSPFGTELTEPILSSNAVVVGEHAAGSCSHLVVEELSKVVEANLFAGDGGSDDFEQLLQNGSPPDRGQSRESFVGPFARGRMLVVLELELELELVLVLGSWAKGDYRALERRELE